MKLVSREVFNIVASECSSRRYDEHITMHFMHDDYYKITALKDGRYLYADESLADKIIEDLEDEAE